MKTLDTQISIHICGTPAQRTKLVNLLSRITTAGNTHDVSGYWQGISETDTVLTHWLDGDADNARLVNRIVRALRTYQTYADQTAILVEVNSHRTTFALVIEAGDWADATEALLFHLNYTEQLLRYFHA